MRDVLPAWLALAFLIVGIAFYAHDVTSRMIRQGSINDLRAIAQLQAGQIRQWLTERQDEAAILATPHFIETLQDWLDHGNNSPSLRTHLTDQIQPGTGLHQSRRYVLRSAAEGDRLLSIPEAGLPTTFDRPEARQRTLEAASLEKTVFDDLHFIGNDPAQGLRFGFFVPLIEPGRPRVRAVLQISLSPEDFLYPLLRAWPTASASGETLLLRREKDAVRYLNPLRRRAESPMALRRVLTPDMPLLAGKIIEKGSGVYEGVDYHGVPCLGYGLEVEGTPWVLLAKVDEAELWRPFRLFTLFGSAMLVLLLLLVLGWMLTRSLARLRVQAALDEAEDLYQNAPCGYHSLDQSACITRINSTGAQMLGYSCEELLGRPITDLMPPERRPGFAQRFEAFAKSETQTVHFELDFVCKTGERLPVHVSASVLRDFEGRFLTSRALVIDISEQHRLEAARRLLQQSIEASFDGFVVVVPEPEGSWRFVYCNAAFEQMTGYPRSEIIGRTPSFLSGPEPDQSELLRLHETVKAGKRFQGTLRNYRKDGSPFLVEVLLDPVRNDEGQVTHYVGIHRGMTAAQEAERLKIARELHDDLGQRLTLLKMNLSLLQTRYDEIPGLFDQAEDILQIAQGMTQSLRQVVRSLRPTVLDMGIVGALEWLVEQHDKLDGLTCTYAGLQSDPDVSDAIATALFRIAQEALNNASRHAQARHILIRLEQEPDQDKEHGMLCLSVEDDGKGFDPGQRCRGAHYGLLGMEERALSVGGQLTVESQPGRGTRVRMRLPLAPS